MNPDNLHLEELNGTDVWDGRFDTAIIPVGATEYHGDHLPYGADSIMATAVAERIAKVVGTALVLPVISYGVSLHHLSFPWSVSVTPESLTRYIQDIGESLVQNGIRRLVFVSAHDGNPAPIENASRALVHEHGIDIALFTGWQRITRELLAEKGFDVDLDHAGSAEMSVMLYLRPELAHQERAEDVPNENVNIPFKMFSSFEKISDKGYTGAPSRGSAEEGEAILDAIQEHVTPFLRQMIEHDWQLGPWLQDV